MKDIGSGILGLGTAVIIRRIIRRRGPTAFTRLDPLGDTSNALCEAARGQYDTAVANLEAHVATTRPDMTDSEKQAYVNKYNILNRKVVTAYQRREKVCPRT